MNYFRAQHGHFTFEQMQSHNSANGGDGDEAEEKEGLCCCIAVSDLLSNTVMGAMDPDDEVVVFSGYEIERIYDGYRVYPVKEIARFSVEFFETHAEEIAEKYETW